MDLIYKCLNVCPGCHTAAVPRLRIDLLEGTGFIKIFALIHKLLLGFLLAGLLLAAPLPERSVQRSLFLFST